MLAPFPRDEARDAQQDDRHQGIAADDGKVRHHGTNHYSDEHQGTQSARTRDQEQNRARDFQRAGQIPEPPRKVTRFHLAESKQHEAEDELEHAKDKAVRDVWKAYDDTKVALAKHQASAALLTASDKAWAATLDSYQHGLSTFPDVREAERNLQSARTVDQAARAEVLTRAAAFAFATGDLARP